MARSATNDDSGCICGIVLVRNYGRGAHMTEQEIFENLCTYDERNPLYDWPGIPREGCYCDNCFYGRDKLAVEILRLREGDKNE